MTWGLYHLQGEEDHEAGMAVPCVATYLPFFGMCQASILSQEEELLGDLEIETNPIRVFCWKTAAFFRETPKSKSKLMKLLRLLIIQRLHGVSESSGGSVLPLTSLVEIIYRGYDHSYCAEPRSISETLWCIYNITFALIYQWLAFYIASFFFFGKWLWMIEDHDTQLKTQPLPKGLPHCPRWGASFGRFAAKDRGTSEGQLFELAKTEFENWGVFIFSWITRYYQHPSEWIFYSLWWCHYLFKFQRFQMLLIWCNDFLVCRLFFGFHLLAGKRWGGNGLSLRWSLSLSLSLSLFFVLVLVLVLVFVLLLLLLLLVLCCSLLFFFSLFRKILGERFGPFPPKLLAQNSRLENFVSSASWTYLWEEVLRSRSGPRTLALESMCASLQWGRLLQGFGNLWQDSDYTSLHF